MKTTEGLCLLVLVAATAKAEVVQKIDSKDSRLGKLLPIFQVVRFPNDPCAGSTSKNGTCYTAEECSSRSGVSDGTCAEGFGVCCIITLGCGGQASENCTYFEVASGAVPTGSCTARVCKTDSNICQMRLDFSTFTITGPQTVTTSICHQINGACVGIANGVGVATRGACTTDSFTVSNAQGLPEICGEMAGEHVYFNAEDNCHDLNFAIGPTATGISAVATRSWNIKVTQYSCNYNNLAPPGCDQYYYGSTLGTFTSFNWGDGAQVHLAEQHQNICFRREQTFCRICFSADAAADVQVGGWDTDKSMAAFDGNVCCAYGTKGVSTNKGAYDCFMIPGATKAADNAILPASQCGNKVGLISAAAGTASATICSSTTPFRFDFYSDAWEHAVNAKDEATAGGIGFKIRFFQTSC